MKLLRMKRVLGIKTEYVVLVGDTKNIYAWIKKAKHGWAVYQNEMLIGYQNELDEAFTFCECRFHNQGRRRNDDIKMGWKNHV